MTGLVLDWIGSAGRRPKQKQNKLNRKTCQPVGRQPNEEKQKALHLIERISAMTCGVSSKDSFTSISIILKKILTDKPFEREVTKEESYFYF